MDHPVRHLAGPYTEGVQRCTRCLCVITDNRNTHDQQGDSFPPFAFKEGDAIINFGPSWLVEFKCNPDAVDCKPDEELP